MEGTTVDSKYEVTRLLGRGGMGAVYEAVHRGTGRRVALKVIIPEALGEGDVLARFRREARASGAIESQHVVQVLDTGVDPGTNSPYLVMEFLKGQDVSHVLATTGPIAPEVVLRVMAQACSGLARAHREGVIHRDIKSANLFLAQREEDEVVVKLLDFGIAKLRPDHLPASNRHKLTRSGSILGSPLYMSPEQLLGARELDLRSDIFSLGVTMYEALCGVTPNNEVTNIGRLVIEICGGKGVPLETRAPHLPAALYAIVRRATAIDPAHRYQTAAEMQAALVALLPGGSALTERMIAPVVDPRALADTQLPATQNAPVPFVTAQLAAPGSAPSLAETATLAGPRSPTFPPPALAATSSAFSGHPSSPRSGIAPVVWAAGAVVALVALIGVASLLRPLAKATTTTTTSSPPAANAPAEPPPAPPAVAVPETATAAPAAAPSASVDPPHVAKPKPKPKAPSCNPPYERDSNGVQKFKLECMK